MHNDHALAVLLDAIAAVATAVLVMIFVVIVAVVPVAAAVKSFGVGASLLHIVGFLVGLAKVVGYLAHGSNDSKGNKEESDGKLHAAACDGQ